MNKILLFDFDGTIADSFENFIEIVGKLAVLHKLPQLNRVELEALRGDDARTLIKKLRIPFYKIPFLARDMKKLQREQIKEIKPISGLSVTLMELKKKGYILGILTSNGLANVKQFLMKNNIVIFDYVYTDSNIFGKDKVINKFLKQNAVGKAEVIYIGDEIRDIQACQKVGVKVIAVTWGFNSKEGLKKHNPDFLADNPSDLLQIVENN